MFGIKELFNYTKKKNGKVKDKVKALEKELNAEGVSEEKKAEIQAKIAEEKIV